MRRIARSLLGLLIGGAAVAAALTAVVVGGYYYVEPGLPHAEQLRDVQFQEPLRVYSRDGRLIQQYGPKRAPVDYEEIPEVLVRALVAAEDDRFFEHIGFDIPRTAYAIVNYLIARGDERPRGSSTITQQVAREYFLNQEVSLERKFKEWILALRIEAEFTKEEILELFFNTTFFGQNSYGVAAAAQTYFGKELGELTLSEAAILAGIPWGPSIANPIYSRENAARRRAYVLGRMRELGYVNEVEYRAALAEPISGERHGVEMQLDAPYIAEMVRLEMLRKFGDSAYTAGLKVTATVDSRLQEAAQAALRQGLIDYDQRHGYRGPIRRLELPPVTDAKEADGAPDGAFDEERLREALADYPPLVGFEAGVVLHADAVQAEVYLPSRGRVTIGLPAVAWAAPQLNEKGAVGARPDEVSDVLARGDIVRFTTLEDGSLQLAQLPEVQGAFVALDPSDGAIVALSGGFDFYLDSYNRATQSNRQPGSSFKPFVYSAALENGFTVATIVNDAPITIEDPVLETVWKPENYEKRFYGYVRLREALIHSINTASVRVILKAGIMNTVRHLQKFGFDEVALPPNAALALGVGGVSPLELAAGYAVFANGGFRVTPYFIDRIENAAGEVLYQAQPAFACGDCVEVPAGDEEPALIEDVTELYPPMRLAPRAISPQNAYLVTDMLHDAAGPGGTGARARRELGRLDIAGKTGTTNDLRDAWFAGFNPDVVAAAWVGFNFNRPLGGREQGAVTALPIWTAFMKEALEGVPERTFEEPPGIVTVRINPENGLVASGANPNTIFEKFRIGHLPEREPDAAFPTHDLPASPEGPATQPREIF
ncbi:MAG TPA: PBP1A family penicillin-binding protein [Gammaproteobacteria bacterium]